MSNNLVCASRLVFRLRNGDGYGPLYALYRLYLRRLKERWNIEVFLCLMINEVVFLVSVHMILWLDHVLKNSPRRRGGWSFLIYSVRILEFPYNELVTYQFHFLINKTFKPIGGDESQKIRTSPPALAVLWTSYIDLKFVSVLHSS